MRYIRLSNRTVILFKKSLHFHCGTPGPTLLLVSRQHLKRAVRESIRSHLIDHHCSLPFYQHVPKMSGWKLEASLNFPFIPVHVKHDSWLLHLPRSSDSSREGLCWYRLLISVNDPSVSDWNRRYCLAALLEATFTNSIRFTNSPICFNGRPSLCMITKQPTECIEITSKWGYSRKHDAPHWFSFSPVGHSIFVPWWSGMEIGLTCGWGVRQRLLKLMAPKSSRKRGKRLRVSSPKWMTGSASTVFPSLPADTPVACLGTANPNKVDRETCRGVEFYYVRRSACIQYSDFGCWKPFTCCCQ